MNAYPRDISPNATDIKHRTTEASLSIPLPGNAGNTSGMSAVALRTPSSRRSGTANAATGDKLASASRPRGTLSRGLSAQLPSDVLQERAWTIGLSVASRFRVIRTLDVAVACYPERPFKTALGAAQRAVRGLVKAHLLKRYKTQRFQTVYGLTQRGADWLAERGVDARASIRRVSDMTNPEHRLWAQFLALCAERRGLEAMTEVELLARLNKASDRGSPMKAALMNATARVAGRLRAIAWRPDAVVIEGDGLTALEVDCSARGSLRAASLRAQALCVGGKVSTGHILRRVVVWCRTDRIRSRVLATLQELARETASHGLRAGRRQLRATDELGTFEVWMTLEVAARDGRSFLQEEAVGHVIVQDLPTWLPKVRIDARNKHSTAGWLEENFLPWRRPTFTGAWRLPSSPLVLVPGAR